MILSNIKNKRGTFKPFWVLLALMGIMLIGSFINPIKITQDFIFQNIEDNAEANGTPEFSCTSPEAKPLMKATCFTLGGTLVFFVLYLLFMWISGMVAGAKANKPVFAPRYRQMQAALEQ